MQQKKTEANCNLIVKTPTRHNIWLVLPFSSASCWSQFAYGREFLKLQEGQLLRTTKSKIKEISWIRRHSYKKKVKPPREQIRHQSQRIGGCLRRGLEMVMLRFKWCCQAREEQRSERDLPVPLGDLSNAWQWPSFWTRLRVEITLAINANWDPYGW